MMGGSQQTQPTKYNLLSRSLIHLLHSDQFVLINPHKGTVSETKAPGEQWKVPHAPETQPPPLSTSLHLKCSPSQHTVAPGCHRRSSLWAGQSRTSEAHLKEGARKKIPISSSRVKYLRKEEKKNTQCNVSYCIQVTPSINSEINLDVAYKERLQRKGRGGYSNFKYVRKLGFLCSCLSHLLQLWLENAVCYCVITLSCSYSNSEKWNILINLYKDMRHLDTLNDVLHLWLTLPRVIWPVLMGATSWT